MSRQSELVLKFYKMGMSMTEVREVTKIKYGTIKEVFRSENKKNRR